MSVHLPEAPDRHGLNAQLEYARETLDAPALLILHADLPLADAAAVRRLVAAAPPAPSITLVESLDGGTNAMLLQPPGGVALAYGPGSAAAHREAAAAAGYTVTAADEPSLQLDLDTRDDLARLLAWGRGAHQRCRALSARMRCAARLAPGPGID
ncbi:MAG: hypothetical protein U5Q44_05025 [Dehalococcoidia bacterium]|nr:hypothetical protein [Dehalococcoidia bacterium]